MPKPNIEKLSERLFYDEEVGKLKTFPGAKSIAAPFQNGSSWYYRINGTPIKAQDLVWALIMGQWPEFKLRFKDGNSDNYKFENLELDDPTVAAPKAQKYKGVVRVGAYRFKAQIRNGNKVEYLGHFDTAEQARDAVIEAESKFVQTRRAPRNAAAQG